jgi:hypothetical protein
MANVTPLSYDEKKSTVFVIIYEKCVSVIAEGNYKGKWSLRDIIPNKKCFLMYCFLSLLSLFLSIFGLHSLLPRIIWFISRDTGQPQCL